MLRLICAVFKYNVLLGQGFRLCGGDQRALRSPSGLLRAHSHVTGFSLLQGESRLRARPKGFAKPNMVYYK